MNELINTEDIDAFRKRFMLHLPEDSEDNALVILKGHLLAEEILTEYIVRKIKHSEHLSLTDNHWGFVNKLELAWALSSDKHHQMWIWSSLKKLNAVRNKYSHSLEPKGVDKISKDLHDSISLNVPGKFHGAELSIYGCVVLLVSSLFTIVNSEYKSDA